MTKAEKQSSQVYCVIYSFHTLGGPVSTVSTFLRNNDRRKTIIGSGEGIIHALLILKN